MPMAFTLPEQQDNTGVVMANAVCRLTGKETIMLKKLIMFTGLLGGSVLFSGQALAAADFWIMYS